MPISLWFGISILRYSIADPPTDTTLPSVRKLEDVLRAPDFANNCFWRALNHSQDAISWQSCCRGGYPGDRRCWYKDMNWYTCCFADQTHALWWRAVMHSDELEKLMYAGDFLGRRNRIADKQEFVGAAIRGHHTFPLRKYLSPGKQRLLIVMHEDDETLFAGGLLVESLKCVNEAVSNNSSAITDPGCFGWTIVIVAAPLDDDSEKTRLKELVQALDALGVLGLVNVEFALTVDCPFCIPDSEVKDRITAILDQTHGINDDPWDMVVTHGPYGEYGHPQHVELSLLTTSYLAQKRRLQSLHYILPIPRAKEEVMHDKTRLDGVKAYESQFKAWGLIRVDSRQTMPYSQVDIDFLKRMCKFWSKKIGYDVRETCEQLDGSMSIDFQSYDQHAVLVDASRVDPIDRGFHGIASLLRTYRHVFVNVFGASHAGRRRVCDIHRHYALHSALSWLFFLPKDSLLVINGTNIEREESIALYGALLMYPGRTHVFDNAVGVDIDFLLRGCDVVSGDATLMNGPRPDGAKLVFVRDAHSSSLILLFKAWARGARSIHCQTADWHFERIGSLPNYKHSQYGHQVEETLCWASDFDS